MQKESLLLIFNECFMILNDDEGNYQYAWFTNGIKKDNDLRKIKGKDF